jgi:hypothetical protein
MAGTLVRDCQDSRMVRGEFCHRVAKAVNRTPIQMLGAQKHCRKLALALVLVQKVVGSMSARYICHSPPKSTGEDWMSLRTLKLPD